jgi:uncharacterized protein Usg
MRELRQLEGLALTTAEILYRLPDYPRLLQSYIWQDCDLAREFPKLLDFLDLLGRQSRWVTLPGVRVAHRRLFSFVQGELRLN